MILLNLPHRCDPTGKRELKRELKLQSFFILVKKGEIDDTIYKKILPTGSSPSILYGLPKFTKMVIIIIIIIIIILLTPMIGEW